MKSSRIPCPERLIILKKGGAVTRDNNPKNCDINFDTLSACIPPFMTKLRCNSLNMISSEIGLPSKAWRCRDRFLKVFVCSTIVFFEAFSYIEVEHRNFLHRILKTNFYIRKHISDLSHYLVAV